MKLENSHHFWILVRQVLNFEISTQVGIFLVDMLKNKKFFTLHCIVNKKLFVFTLRLYGNRLEKTERQSRQFRQDFEKIYKFSNSISISEVNFTL